MKFFPDHPLTTIDRLIIALRSNPKAMAELLIKLGVPCEGFQGRCGLPAECIVDSMTAYTEEAPEGHLGPNRDLFMCTGCADGYTQMMEDQWKDYWSGRM
jgi:hypothetical protein